MYDLLSLSQGDIRMVRGYCHQCASILYPSVRVYDYSPISTIEEQDLKIEYNRWHRRWAILDHLFTQYQIEWL